MNSPQQIYANATPQNWKFHKFTRRVHPKSQVTEFTYPKITKIFQNQNKTTNDKNCETSVSFRNPRTHAKYTSYKTSQSNNHEIRPKKNVEKDKKPLNSRETKLNGKDNK